MRNRFFGIVLFAIFLQTPSGDCGANFSSILGAVANTYPASNDPSQQAAEASTTANENSNKAYELQKKAVSKENLAKQPFDYKDIDEAIKLTPGSASLQATKAAMLRAEGKDAAAQAAEEDYFNLMAAGGMLNDTQFFYAVTKVGTMKQVLEALPPGKITPSLSKEFCASVRLAWKSGVAYDEYDGGACGSRSDYRK